MTELQPLGYTVESVTEGCAAFRAETLKVVRDLETFCGIIRVKHANIFRGLEEEIAGFRRRLEAIGEYSDTIPQEDSTEDFAVNATPVYRRLAARCVPRTEYMHGKDASFHFGFLQRMHDTLSFLHPVVLQKGVKGEQVPTNVPADLFSADPALPEWHLHMRNLLHDPKPRNGVTWPPVLGNELARYEFSLSRDAQVAAAKSQVSTD